MSDATEQHGDGPENRLAAESSPYLLLHKHNPVDWYPWGEEALARARDEERPIFLSVGYSTCYWCHVMERESFADPRIAELMNRGFVNVKVDREERPDLDEVYMTATQILTGQGGWPNSVFLTPELKPFYAGTYFPPEDRHGRPGFPSLLRGLLQAWEERRGEVEQQAEELFGAMQRYVEGRAKAGDAPPPLSVLDRAVEGLTQRFDDEYAGFGGAPKFPTPSNLYLLNEVADGSPRAAEMLHATLDAMARGGIYDQLAGGFHRYATDRAWLVPHFEKMLYDNALLLDLLVREYARSGDAEMERVARETAAFLDREMGLPDGGFASAIDAETDGHEGAYYVWTRDELEQLLGDEGFAFLAPLYGFEQPPFFEERSYVLHLPQRLDEQAERRRTARRELLADVAPLRETLLTARGERERPLTDDKVLADWNGMTIAALAGAGRALDEGALVERAVRAADFVLRELRPDGTLHHAWRDGEAKVAALLGDYVWMVRGCLALHRATGEERWLEAAAGLADEQRRRLEDPQDGGYYVAEERDDLLLRSKDLFDGATPAANAVAVLNCLALAEATGEGRWHDEAERTLAAAAPLVEQFPDGARMMTVAAARWHAAAGTPEAAVERRAATAAEAGSALAGAAEETAVVALAVDDPDDDGWHPFRLRLELADGWHANAAGLAEGEREQDLIPTTLAAEGAELRGVDWPAGEAWSAPGGGEIPIYRGTLEIAGEVRPGGDPAAARLVLTWQPCDEARCLPPVTRRVALVDSER